MLTMPNTLLTSNKAATKAQFQRVRNLTKEAIDEASLEQEGFTHDQLQAIHANAAPYKRELAAIVIAFAHSFVKKLLGIVSPASAESTGLIPKNWVVMVRNGAKQDFPEGDVDLAKLDYSACPVRDGEGYINGTKMMERAKEAKAIGSLGLAAELLKAQDEGKEIFPVESRGKYYFIMPLTDLQDVGGRGFVACFNWDGERWVLDFNWLGGHFDSDDRFVRRSE
jgi:hypothetical protein